MSKNFVCSAHSEGTGVAHAFVMLTPYTTIEKLWNSPGIFRLPADSQDSHRRSSALFGWESSGSWKTPGEFQVSSQLQ